MMQSGGKLFVQRLNGKSARYGVMKREGSMSNTEPRKTPKTIRKSPYTKRNDYVI